MDENPETKPTDNTPPPGSSQRKMSDAERKEPVDKKRIALLNGACGQGDRVSISGQVVDIPVTATQKTETWDLVNSIPASQKSKIRPIMDFGMAGVRKARLQLEILERPASAAKDGALTQEELEAAKVLFTSEVFVGNDNSFFQIELKTDLPAGDYIVRVILRGIDSLRQSVSDLAFIGDSKSLILKKDIPIGHGRLRILDSDYKGLIITSDIDQTFLDTRIDSNRGLLGTLFEELTDKKPLPGMPELFREIQAGPIGPVPLYFISASPHFFRRTFSSLFDHLQVDYTGLNLKYVMNTVDSVIRKTVQTVLNLDDLLADGFGPAMERTMKFLTSSVDSIFDHIPYKLGTLLENRLMQPTGAREILLGDNTESDAFIFTLYQGLLLGKMRGAELEEYLYKLKFRGREALTRDAAKRVCVLTEQNLERHGNVNSVSEVWINQAFAEPDEPSMIESIKEALPPNMLSEDELARKKEGEIKLFRACYGAVGFSMLAMESNLIEKEQVERIWNSLMGATLRGESVTAETFRKVAAKLNIARDDFIDSFLS